MFPPVLTSFTRGVGSTAATARCFSCFAHYVCAGDASRPENATIVDQEQTQGPIHHKVVSPSTPFAVSRNSPL